MNGANEYQERLPRGWARTTLGEIAKKLKAGGTPSTKIKEFYEGGEIPFVKIEDMTNSHKYIYDTIVKITADGLKNSPAWIVPENALLYSMYASYGIPRIK
jgi:type I restriction enzyme S subunit